MRCSAICGSVSCTASRISRARRAGEARGELFEQHGRRGQLGFVAEPHAQAELGGVFEERVAPGGAAAFAVDRVGGRGQVAAVDRRAAGGVGDDDAVAEELAQELDVRRLAAAGAGAGELEERLEHLRALDRVVGQQVAGERRDGAEEVPAATLFVAVLLGGGHVDGLVAHLGLGLGRADLDADAAAGAVVGSHLDGDVVVEQRLGLVGDAAEAVGGAGEGLRRVDLHADGGVRADDRALAALDADLGVPDGDLAGDGPLFELGGAGRERAVGRQRADGQQVAFAGHERAGDVFDELRGVVGHGGLDLPVARDLVGHRDAHELGERAVDGGVVALDDGRAAASVGLLDRLLDERRGLAGRQRAGELEEAGLHHGVDAVAQARFVGDGVGVDDPELEVLVDQLLLHVARQVVPDLVCRVGAVQQEGGALAGEVEHLHALEQAELVAGQKVGLGDEIGGADLLGTEAQVRDRHRTALLGVVDEVALHVEVGVLADDLDRALVGAHGAVGAQAEEQRLDFAGRAAYAELGVGVEAQVRDVVVDAHGEVALGRRRRSTRAARLRPSRG